MPNLAEFSIDLPNWILRSFPLLENVVPIPPPPRQYDPRIWTIKFKNLAQLVVVGDSLEDINCFHPTPILVRRGSADYD